MTHEIKTEVNFLEGLVGIFVASWNSPRRIFGIKGFNNFDHVV